MVSVFLTAHTERFFVSSVSTGPSMNQNKRDRVRYSSERTNYRNIFPPDIDSA